MTFYHIKTDHSLPLWERAWVQLKIRFLVNRATLKATVIAILAQPVETFDAGIASVWAYAKGKLILDIRERLRERDFDDTIEASYRTL